MPSLSPLRHQQTALFISVLSRQWYCEKQVDLSMQYPDAEKTSAAMAAGTEGHDRLEERAVPISLDALEMGLSRGEPFTLFEFPLRAAWEEVPIWGRPDLVLLEGRLARAVIEFKFLGQTTLFPSRQTQALLYG